MPSKKDTQPSKVLFADAVVPSLEARYTLPAKFDRLLGRLGLAEKVAGKRVGIKMHLGSDIGFTTIPPLFVRNLVDAVKKAGASSVSVFDGRSPKDGIPRGYTPEVLGCPVESCFGESGKETITEAIGFGILDEVKFGTRILDCDVFIDLSHVKGHGDCGFGGALKNIAMGVVPTKTRSKLHLLEGGIEYKPENCTFCLKCLASCPNSAIQADKETRTLSVFFHHCTYCGHCVLSCPQGCITMIDRRFEDFSQGMALVTSAFLKHFAPERLLFINFLTNITMYCDCWGFSSPSLVPDIGILAGTDIAAVDTASLDLIKVENLLPSGLPLNRRNLGDTGHLFERIHAKNPYVMLRYLEETYPCDSRYDLVEIK